MSEQEATTPLSERHRHHVVSIHIDRTPYESPTPTTGVALYILGKVAPENALFRETEGDQEDKLVPKGEDIVHLHVDEHFYSAVLEFKIIVNGQEKIVHKQLLTFHEVVLLAFDPPPHGPNIIVKVKYENGPHVNHEGSLHHGHEVQIRSGMRFHVTQTDKS